MRRAAVTLRCRECGERFSWKVKGRGRYPRSCSPACHAKRKRAEIHKRTCIVCGAPFTTDDRKTLTCGMRCGKRVADATKRAKMIARRTRFCEVCSQPFVMHKPSAKARRGEVREGRFCSRRCKHAAMRKPVQLGLFEGMGVSLSAAAAPAIAAKFESKISELNPKSPSSGEGGLTSAGAPGCNRANSHPHKISARPDP
jgi:hypothetical protein